VWHEGEAGLCYASAQRLIEIRPIHRKEAEPFLALLCTVFSLDIARARHVFFKEPMFDLDRKWALFEDGEMRTIMTTTPLKFGFGRAFGVAGVATVEAHRGRGLAKRILEHVLEHGRASGEPGCILFAHSEEVYRRVGFQTIDTVVRGPIVVGEMTPLPDVVRYEQVRKLYDAWAGAKPARLVRDERRWKYWRWIPRTCEAAPGGYVCVEPHICREALLQEGLDEWPVMPGTSWLGLKSMTQELRIPLTSSSHELFVMAHSLSERPEMFMTDQF
jgi:predicted N-acetyltransferase YhbS